MKDEHWEKIRIKIRDQGIGWKSEELFRDIDPNLDYKRKLEIITRDVALYADARMVQVLNPTENLDVHMVNILGNAMGMYAACLPERHDRKVSQMMIKVIRSYRKLFKMEGIWK